GVQQVLEQREQLADLGVNQLDALALPLVELALGGVEENPAIPVDEGEGRSQLVGGHGDELALHLLEDLQLSNHAVEGSGERAHLVPLAIVDADAEIAAGHPGNALAQ